MSSHDDVPEATRYAHDMLVTTHESLANSIMYLSGTKYGGLLIPGLKKIMDQVSYAESLVKQWQDS